MQGPPVRFILLLLALVGAAACASKEAGESPPPPPPDLDGTLVIAQARFDEVRARDGLAAALLAVEELFRDAPAVQAYRRDDYGVAFLLASAPPDSELVFFAPDRSLLDWGTDTSSIGRSGGGLRPGPVTNEACLSDPPARKDPQQLETARDAATGEPLRTAVILDSLENEYDIAESAAWSRARPDFVAALESVDYQVEVRDSRAFTVADVIEAARAGVFVFTYHGVRMDGEVSAFPDIDWDPEALDALGVMHCGRSAGSLWGLLDYAECDAIRGEAGGIDYTILTPRFFERFLPPMPNNLVILMACHQLADDSEIPAAFTRAGAHTIMGSTERGLLRKWGRLMDTLGADLTRTAWDVEGALARGGEDRVGLRAECVVDECVVPPQLGQGACTQSVSRNGTLPWAVLTDLDVSFAGVPSANASIEVSARLFGVTDEDAELGRWSLPAGTTQTVLQMPSASNPVTFCARAGDEETSLVLTPHHAKTEVAFDFASGGIPAPVVPLPACETVEGEMRGVCPRTSADVALPSPGRITAGGTLAFEVSPLVPACDHWNIPSDTWTPSPCYAAINALQVTEDCVYLDPTTNEVHASRCRPILYRKAEDQATPWNSRWTYEGVRYDIRQRTVITTATCGDEASFSVYARGGPANNPSAIWSARGPVALPCGVTYTGPRPDGLYGPTWVRVTVSLDVAESGMQHRTRVAPVDVYVPIDGDMRGFCPRE